MTTTLKQQIEQWIERASNDSVEKWFKDNGWVATEGKVIPSIAAYTVGANSMLPLLMCAVEALEEYHDLHYAPKLEEALNKIKQMIEVK